MKLVRSANDQTADAIFWDPKAGALDPSKISDVDAVINLAGENIAEGRWTEKRKAEILSSRIDSTRLLTQTCSTLLRPPKVFLSASAIGFYGPQPGLTVDESSPQGPGFLAEVCRKWEEAATPVSAVSRLVFPRFGVILSLSGGAASKMLPAFRLGLGGKIGDGSRLMSWIALPDALRALLHCIETGTISGPVNFVSPRPATNAEFTSSLANAVHRPAWFTIPPLALRIAFGEMADETILTSSRVVPRVLESTQFHFRNVDIRSAFEP